MDANKTLTATFTRLGGEPNCNSATSNLTLVKRATDQLFNQRSVAAVDQYWDVNHINHNPGAMNGSQFLKDRFANDMTSVSNLDIGFGMAEGDLVMTYDKYERISGEAPLISVDVYRVAGGKLIEHWDVLQIEATTPSGNPLFPIPSVASDFTSTNDNKTLVKNALTALYTNADASAVNTYWATNYQEHSTFLNNGQAGLTDRFITNRPASFNYEFGFAMQQGAFVFVHSRYTGLRSNELTIDIAGEVFKVENNKIVAHWMVLQREVPASQTISGNAMFPVSSQCSGSTSPTPTPPCNIEISILNQACDDMGTTDPEDDFYTFDVLVNGTGTSTTGFLLQFPNGFNGTITTNGQYGQVLSLGPFPSGTFTNNIGNVTTGGVDIELFVSDNDNRDCGAFARVEAANVCTTSPQQETCLIADFSGPAPMVQITNSTCGNGETTPTGGVIHLPATVCPQLTTLEYSKDGTNWSTTLPTYNQTTPMTISTRCFCVDVTITQPTSVTTQPGTCQDTGSAACETPSNPEILFLSKRKLILQWSSIDNAKGYVLQSRLKGRTNWAITALLPSPIARLFVVANKDFEYRIKTICKDESESAYSPVYEFSTRGNNFNIPSAESRTQFKADIDLTSLTYPAQQWRLGPNPVMDQLQLNYTVESDNAQILIYHISGKKVLEQRLTIQNTVHTSDLSHLQNGLYFLMIRDGSKTISARIVKENMY